MKSWIGPVAAGACVLAVAIAGSAALSGQKADEPWGGVLDEHPRIAYASRPTTDRVAALIKKTQVLWHLLDCVAAASGMPVPPQPGAAEGA